MPHKKREVDRQAEKYLENTAIPKEYYDGTVNFLVNMMSHEAYKNPDYKWCLDDFDLGSRLGRGKFGRLFIAYKQQTGYVVALKTLVKEEIVKGRVERRILREILIQSHLKHPNILELLTWFHDDYRIYLVLEFAGKAKLYKHLKSSPGGHFDEHRYGIKDISLKGDKIFIALILLRKFGNLPVRYIRTKIETEELKVLEKALKIFHFNLHEDDQEELEQAVASSSSRKINNLRGRSTALKLEAPPSPVVTLSSDEDEVETQPPPKRQRTPAPGQIFTLSSDEEKEEAETQPQSPKKKRKVQPIQEDDDDVFPPIITQGFI